MTRLRTDCGQAAVLTVIFLAALLGAMALVLDVGSWFREQRSSQSAADAAALAAAQELPGNTSSARALASQYLTKNPGGNQPSTAPSESVSVAFSSASMVDDTVTVEVKRGAAGVFAKVFGIKSVNVTARATARAVGIDAALGVAPIVVNVKHPMLNCGASRGKPVPCFGTETQLDLVNLHDSGSKDAAGSFGLINLDSESGGNVGASTLSQWVSKGFDRYMPLGKYNAAPSANFNNSQFVGALSDRMPDELLFPIYKAITGPGSNAVYDIIGWVGFKVSYFNPNGSKSFVRGSFVSVVWEGIHSNSGANMNYGVRAIELVE